MKSNPTDFVWEAESAEMQDEEFDDNGPPSWDPVLEDSGGDRSQIECDEEDCLWPTDDEDDNGVDLSFIREDSSRTDELKSSVEDKHEDSGGTKREFLKQDDPRDLDERYFAATSYGDFTSLAVKKQHDDLGGVNQDGAERPRASYGRNQDETNKDTDFVQESVHAIILNDPKVLSSFHDDSENLATAEKVGGSLRQKRIEESIGEHIKELQKTPEDERILTEKTSEDEQSLTEKKPDDERSLTEKKTVDERSLTEKTQEDERSLTEKTQEDERGLTEKTQEDERSLTKKTQEDERSLTEKTQEDERSLTEKKTVDERSLTESVEDETQSNQRQTVQNFPVDFFDTGTGVPPPDIGREDTSSTRRRKLKAGPDGGTEEFDPGPGDGDERKRALQLINQDSNARNTTMEPDEGSSQVVECGAPEQSDNHSTKAAKPWSISTFLPFLVLVVYFPTSGPNRGVDGALTVIPRDVLAPSGSLARLRCSTDYGSPVYWERMVFGTDEQQTIYYGKNGMAGIPGGRFSVEEDSASGRYDLVIRNVQLEDAGTYVCIDEAGIGDGYRAELVVSERFTCQMSVPRNGFMGENIFDITEDPVKSTCSLGFRGNVVPRFQWTWGKTTRLEAPTIINGSTATSSVTFRATHDMSGTSLSCLPRITTQSASLDESGRWTSKPVFVRYVYVKFGSVEVCQSSAMIPICNPECTYKMQKTDDDKCRCLAVYNDHGKNYTKTFNEYTCEISAWPQNTVIAVTIIVAVLAVIAASVIVVCIYRITHRKEDFWEICGIKLKNKSKANPVSEVNSERDGSQQPLREDC